MRILVVEDNEALRDMTAATLATPGIVIDAVGTCSEALTLMRTNLYAWTVLDNSLPDGRGIDLVRTAHAARLTNARFRFSLGHQA